eukprot:scaffold8972_cov118-Isochrysis_galbana.AAC.16
MRTKTTARAACARCPTGCLAAAAHLSAPREEVHVVCAERRGGITEDEVADQRDPRGERVHLVVLELGQREVGPVIPSQHAQRRAHQRGRGGQPACGVHLLDPLELPVVPREG